MKASPLPAQLAPTFSTTSAKELGVSKTRLRASDLENPFRGVRMTVIKEQDQVAAYASALKRERALIKGLGVRLVHGQFFSHRSAALLWGAPLPHRESPDLHVGVIFPQRAPRIKNVSGHCFLEHRITLRALEGLPLTSPASVFASLGSLSLSNLVALGDYFVRVYRQGYGRRDVGKPPLATIAELDETTRLGHWQGAPRLRKALELIREDSWSPRESSTRVAIVMAGLPEPDLNVDIFDRQGYFLACVDMAYVRYKIAVEYQGKQHADTFAHDVERIEALRAEGWEVIQVTAALVGQPFVLTARVAQRLRARGWRG